MLITTNTTNTIWDLERYKDSEDMVNFCNQQGLDGFEILFYGDFDLRWIPAEKIKGLHLSYYNAWVDFWNNNEAGIIEEYDTVDKARSFLGQNKQAMIEHYQKQLDLAETLGVAYVVFHVTDISTKETLTYERKHSDEVVVKACLELINQLLEGQDYHFDFLVENLWWAGFDFLRPEITRQLIEGIRYDHKGIMLDTGHLMHTNLELETENQAIEYIKTCLEKQGSLKEWIKGVHLQQSLTGEVVRQMLEASPYDASMTYEERMAVTYSYVFKIDTHMPFTSSQVQQLINIIQPAYLTHEFISRDRAEHESKIECQRKALGLE